MSIAPPTHLSPAATHYMLNPDALDYPLDWTDAWDVHSVREVSHALWCEVNKSLDFPYEVAEDTIGGVPCERIRAIGVNPSGVTILHFHGGMYCLGTPEIDRALNAPIARNAGAEIISVDYRLAPEYPFPGALDDGLAVWSALIADDRKLIILGESAGGGLAAAVTIAARDRGLAMPAGLILISPMLDLTGSSDSFTTLTKVDPDYGMNIEALLAPGHAYAADMPLDHPLISPMYADHRGLPPTLIQVGNREVLLGDSTRFARAARSADVDVRVQIQDAGWHNYPIWYGVPEADAAITAIGNFIRDVT